MSTNPGEMILPVASTISTPSGREAGASAVMEAIRSLVMSTEPLRTISRDCVSSLKDIIVPPCKRMLAEFAHGSAASAATKGRKDLIEHTVIATI